MKGATEDKFYSFIRIFFYIFVPHFSKNDYL